MDLDNYVGAASGHVEELAEEIEAIGWEAAHDMLRQAGMAGWKRYVGQNRHLMLEYLALTPSRRQRKHRDLEPEQRAIFLLGCLWYARMGRVLLRLLADRPLGPGESYRSTTAQAANIAHRLVFEIPTPWPFEDGDPLGQNTSS